MGKALRSFVRSLILFGCHGLIASSSFLFFLFSPFFAPFDFTHKERKENRKKEKPRFLEIFGTKKKRTQSSFPFFPSLYWRAIYLFGMCRLIFLFQGNTNRLICEEKKCPENR